MAKTILIVDDDKDIVKAMQIVLEGNNYKTIPTYTLEDGEKAIKKQKPDLIILDVMFPENLDGGFELSKKIKTDEATKNIPILMYSAIGNKLSREDLDADESKADEIVDKIIDPEDLLEKIANLLK
jgi:DNA-binding response OmpR family regulator